MSRVLTVSNADSSVTVPEDVYKAEVIGLQEKQMEWDNVIQNKIEITFRLDDEEFDGVEVRGLASLPAKLTPKCKLRAWAQAIIGRELAENEQFDLDTLVGKKCRVRITNKEGRQGGTFSNVTDVLPLRANRSTMTANY